MRAGQAPLRVLDLTDELAFQGARLLVGLGAEVVRIEPGRDLDPAARVHWHAGKRWVRGADDAELDALAAGADIVLESGPAATLRGLRGDGSWIHAGRHPVRNGGVYEHVAHRIFAAADGYVAGGYSGSDRMWTDLLAWLAAEGEADDLTDPRWSDPTVRWNGRHHVDGVIARFAAKRSARDIAADARARALPWAEVVGPGRLAENPQLRDRRFFVTVRGEDLPGGEVEDVGFPWEAVPRPTALAVISETTAERAWPRVASPGRRRPWQDPEAGADVIKIESRHRQDPTRFAPSMRLRPGAGSDDSGYFVNFNHDKRSVALNLRTREGQRLLRDLVRHCDVVVENFSPGVLARWGMDHAALRTLNPDVIGVSMAGLGQTGPWRDAVTFADTLAAMSGLSSETRDPGGGGHVDLSQLEAMAGAMGPALVAPALSSAALSSAGCTRPA